MAWSCHRLRPRASASGTSLLPGPPEPPTASHLAAVAHDTEYSLLPVAPVGLGVCWIFHFWPFQCSASVNSTLAPLVRYPTAVHAVAFAQDTSIRKLAAAPLGLGVLRSFHCEPFQRSDRATVLLDTFV